MEGLEGAQASSPSPDLRRNSLELEGRSDRSLVSNCRLEPRGTETTQRGGSEARMLPRLGGGGATTKGTRRGRGGRERYGEERRLRLPAGQVPFKEGRPVLKSDRCGPWKTMSGRGWANSMLVG